MTAGSHLADADPFFCSSEWPPRQPKPLDAGHAFYLGYEMAKAATALTLEKIIARTRRLTGAF